MVPSDLPGVVGLQRACFPAPFPEELLWKASDLEAHLSKFPEGQFVAEHDGQIVASASANRVSEATWQAHLPWEETMGGFTFNNFDSDGTTLYGADISVHPDHRGQGLGRRLYEARFDLVRRLGLTRYGTACRLPDFHRSGVSVEDYVARVARGETTDRTLTPLLRFGLRLAGVIHNYMEDEESGNAAALLEWRP